METNLIKDENGNSSVSLTPQKPDCDDETQRDGETVGDSNDEKEGDSDGAEYKQAIKSPQHMLDSAKKAGDADAEGVAYSKLGVAYHKLGDFKECIECSELALHNAKELGNREREGIAYCNLGNGYEGLGDLKRAMDYFKFSLHIAIDLGDRTSEGRAYSNLGGAYCGLGNIKEATHYHQLSPEIAKKEGDREVEGSAYCNIGLMHRFLHDFKQAIEYQKKYLYIVKERGDKNGEGHACLNLGLCYLELGDFEQAKEYCQRALTLFKETGDRGGVARAYHGCGLCSENLGNKDEALLLYEASLKQFNEMRLLLQCKDESNITFRSTYQDVYNRFQNLLLKQNKIVEALSTAEHGRAQALEDRLHSQYGFEAVQSDENKLGSSEMVVYTRSPVLYLAVEENVIKMWLLQEGKLALSTVKEIDANQLKGNDADNLKSFIQNTVNNIQIQNIESEDLSILYDVTVGAVADLIHGTDLIIVPDGPLFLAPFAALVDPKSRRYLCEFFRIRIFPSLTILKMISLSPPDYHCTRSALIVGDPCLERIVRRSRRRNMKLLSQLNCAKEEAEMVGRIVNVKPLIGKDATKAEVLKRLNTVALVHIAARGESKTGEIALAPNPSADSKILKREDFMLTMADVLNVGLRARLVVLSYCNSGCGEINAEGVVGISRAFLGAGARSVLVSLWNIGDEATLEFMRKFYQHLVHGKSASEALNEAMKGMRESQEFNAVRDWAPFVLIGDDVILDFHVNAPPEILARGPLAIEAYNKALLEGTTRVKRVPVMVIGQDRSGKTSIKKSLMGKPFDPQEGSTVGIEVDPSYFEVSTEIWKTKQEDEGAHSNPAISYEHHVARLTCGSLMKEGTALKGRSVSPLTVRMDDTVPLVQGQELDVGFSNESSIRENHSKATEAAKDLEDKEGNLDLPADNVPHPSSQGGSYQSAGSQEDNPPLIVPEEVPEDVATLITEFLKDGDGEEDEKEVYSVLWDFGGQSVYYAIHPLFLTPQAIYLLIYDLSRNAHAAIPVRKQGVYKKVLDDYCRKTNIDYLDVWMSSVASLASRDEANPESLESEKLPKSLPPVFLVCTHADTPYGDADCREQATEIFGSLQTKPYSNHLFEDVFAVDNTKSGSGQECPEVMRLRREVHTVATELLQMKKDIPLKWLKYEKHLRIISEKGHKWISLDEARKVAFEVCKIVSEEEFSTLLNFLHDQRILMHFSDTAKLNKMVILDIRWLIDVFKKVITVKRFDPKEKQFTKLWNKLEKTGILEGKLLEHVWGPLFDKKETVEGLIAIMEKFSLLCAWPFSNGNLQYLVPSMLMSQPPDEVLQLLASARVASLFVKFDSGQVPQGLFPRLVLQFFQWCTQNWSSQLQPQLFHNFARFYTRSDDGRSVIFLCHSTSIEVVVHSGSTVRNYSDDLAENVRSKINLNEEFKHDPLDVLTCRGVVEQLESVLNCMREEFCWLKHVKCEMYVCCTVCCHSRSVRYCRTHHKQGCKQEECLHFFPESELRKCQQFIICPNSAVAGDNKVQVQQFAPWFPFLDEKKEAGDGSGGKHATAGYDDITSFKTDSLSERVLSHLARDVCSSWKALGKQLCLTDADLQQIEADNQELYDRCYSVLKRWTHAKASQATCEDLARALQSKPVERGDLAVKYCSVNEAQESKEVSSPIMDSSFTIKDGKPTEEEILSIAKDVLEVNWKQLGRDLEVTDSVLCEVDYDCTQLFEKIHAMLMKWKQVKGKDATYRHLAEGLESVGRNDLIGKLCCALKIETEGANV